MKKGENITYIDEDSENLNRSLNIREHPKEGSQWSST